MATPALRLLIGTSALALLASCGGAAVDPGGGTASTPPPGTTTTEMGDTTLRGTVRSGVEPDCLVLTAGGREYLLIGAEATALREGEEVEVRGDPRPDMATTCQQGTPFEVAEVLD